MVTEAIKPGYKQTEIGFIPEDWDLVSYNDVFDFLRTASYSRSELSENGDILYVHYGDIHTRWDNIIDLNQHTLPAIDKSKQKNYSLIKEGDLIMADASEDYEGVGKSVEVKNINDKKVISGLHTILLRDKNDLFVNGFKGYIHSNIFVKKQFNRLATGLKVYGISKSNLRLVLIPYPTEKKEQSTISQALFDTNELIQKINKIISKKKNIKKGVMQELLTGKKRLPGFDGEWQKKKLIEITTMPVTDGPHLTPKFIKNGIPFLSVNNIVNFKINWSDLRYISKENDIEFSKKCKPKKGDILLGKAATVGTVAVVDSERDFNIWSPLALIRIKNNYNVRFFYYYFQTPDLAYQIKLFTNSSSQGNIGMRDIEKLEFPVPDPEEQASIAKILSVIDAEIEGLEQTRNKYKMIKKGMMQQLLTGRIRLQ